MIIGHGIWRGGNGLVAFAAAVALLLQSLSLVYAQGVILPTDPMPLVAKTARGDRTFSVEIARDPGERSIGLMHREAMEADHGMLFVFPEQQLVGFWMKDTPLPLDLIFIGQDGLVKAIEPGQPLSEASIAPGEPVRFVLELNAGTAAKTGIVAGTEIRHREINEAGGAAKDPPDDSTTPN